MSCGRKLRENKCGNRCKTQSGGASSDYSHSFHSQFADPAQLSMYTLKYINQAPMFNPLSQNTVIPTGTSGIIPTGAYYDAVSLSSAKNMTGPVTGQYGGGKRKNPWIEHVKSFAKKHKLTYPQALRHPSVKNGYKKKL
jgi:hypothetical protein